MTDIKNQQPDNTDIKNQQPDNTEPKNQSDPSENPPEMGQILELLKNNGEKIKSFESAQINAAAEHKTVVDELKGQISELKNKNIIPETVPDVLEDPEGFSQFMQKKFSDVEKKLPTGGNSLTKREVQEIVLRGQHTDYDEKIIKANVMVKTDVSFRNKLAISDNPPLTAYNHMTDLEGKKKTAEDDQEHNLNQLSDLGNSGNYYRSGKTRTGAEIAGMKKIEKGFGFPEGDLAKHIKVMEARAQR